MATTSTNGAVKTTTVKVEYDWGSDGERKVKEFPSQGAARSFFITKENAGKNPKILSGSPETQVNGVVKDKKEAPVATATEAPAPKPRGEVDRFGSRIGSYRNKFNLCFSNVPKTATQLAQESGSPTVLNKHCKALTGRGLLVMVIENGKKMFKLPDGSTIEPAKKAKDKKVPAAAAATTEAPAGKGSKLRNASAAAATAELTKNGDTVEEAVKKIKAKANKVPAKVKNVKK